MSKIFSNKSRTFLVGLAILIALCIATAVSGIVGAARVMRPAGEYEYSGIVHFVRDTTPDEEEYSEDSDTICPVFYTSADGEYTCVINYTYEEWEKLGNTKNSYFRLYTEKDGDGYLLKYGPMVLAPMSYMWNMTVTVPFSRS